MKIYPYVKVNPKVAEFLGLTDRPRFDDGNYMLWRFDLAPLGGNNDETLRKIGGVGFTPTQCRDEQRSGNLTPLPVAEDERFIMEEEALEAVNDEEEGYE